MEEKQRGGEGMKGKDRVREVERETQADKQQNNWGEEGFIVISKLINGRQRERGEKYWRKKDMNTK